jgi:uncharacterized OsmC-like protein
VTYSGFSFSDDEREKVQRVADVHAESCPVARSIGAAVSITTAVDGLS